MGWCSGTDVFDSVVGYLLKTSSDPIGKMNIIRRLAIALEEQDWDCQNDSAYYRDPLVRSVFKKLHPDWFEDAE